jgi:hypothetical protein
MISIHQCKLVDVKKCKIPINIIYSTVIYVIYQEKKKVNYMNNKNALTFMKVEEEIEVGWAYIMFNNMCNELDRWTKMKEKMQVGGSWRTRIFFCHSMLVLE